MRSSTSRPALRFMILLKPGRLSTCRELSSRYILESLHQTMWPESPCRARGLMTPGLHAAWRVHGVVYARSSAPVTDWASCAGKQRRLMKLGFLLCLGSLGLFCCVPSLAAQAGRGVPPASSLVAAAPQAAEQPTVQGPTLSLADAEARALHNQPHLQADALRAQATAKRVQQTRSAYFPQLAGNLTAVQANGDTAVAAGAVTTSSTSTRVAGGFTLSQLVTDFGRTRELVRSARLTAQAASQQTEDVKQQTLRDVDEAYFATEAAESVRGTAVAVLAFRRLLYASSLH